MAAKGYFVTGTDTEVGKTVISLGLMQKLQDDGHKVVGMKPVASGCEPTAEGLRNEDALALQRQSSIELPYEQVNPFSFEPAIAPHIAAQQAGAEIRLDTIENGYRKLADQADHVIVEGVGGWFVPFNSHDTVANLAMGLRLPVILVVGVRLGCINHALLTADAIEHSGIRLAGWVANRMHSDTAVADENIAAIRERVAAPLLGVVPRVTAGPAMAMEVSRHLDQLPV